MVEYYKKYEKLQQSLKCFLLVDNKFSNENVRQLVVDCCNEDQEIFFCDMDKVDWKKYM